jgi:hypothetical protein
MDWITILWSFLPCPLGDEKVDQVELLPAPTLPQPAEDKWRNEQRAFKRQLPELLKSHRHQFVAVHEGKVVESGSDKLAVAGRAYARFGYVPIYVGLVTDQPPPVCRIPGPRLPQLVDAP